MANKEYQRMDQVKRSYFHGFMPLSLNLATSRPFVTLDLQSKDRPTKQRRCFLPMHYNMRLHEAGMSG